PRNAGDENSARTSGRAAGRRNPGGIQALYRVRDREVGQGDSRGQGAAGKLMGSEKSDMKGEPPTALPVVHVIGTGGSISCVGASRTDFIDYGYADRHYTIE